MSQENVERARSLWARIGEDFASGAAGLSAHPWAPDLLYVEDARWPGSGSYRGRAAIMARFEEYREILGTARVVLREVLDAGESVVLIVEMSGESSATGLPWEHEWAYVWTWQDGEVCEWRAYWEKDDALNAAGLAE